MSQINNRKFQKTILNEISISGTSLFSGLDSKLIIKPAEPNEGITFIKPNSQKFGKVVANVDCIEDTNRATTLISNGDNVNTIEHLLSALNGLGVDNVNIEIFGEEIPILDGSSKGFVEKLIEAEIKEFDVLKKNIKIKDPISIQSNNDSSFMHILPSESFKITYILDYPKSIGKQSVTFCFEENNYVEDIAIARTFCNTSEIKSLIDSKSLKGGSLNNAIVYIDRDFNDETKEFLIKNFNLKNKDFTHKKYLNNSKERFSDEAARHKILDIIGDFALLGADIKGHIIAYKTGHKSNIDMVKKIKSVYSNQFLESMKNKIQFNISEIMSLMPHRYPFLLVDRILDYRADKYVKAIKNVTINEPFFKGHFPDNPVMPGVLILEAMAQAGCFLLLSRVDNPTKKYVYFSAINNSRFKALVIPGDQIIFEAKLIKYKLGTVKLSGKAFVNDKLVAESEFMATVVDR